MNHTWQELFDRAPSGIDVEDVRSALAIHRRDHPGQAEGDGPDAG